MFNLLRPKRRIVGIQKAADYAGVSRWVLRRWIDARKFPIIRYPGKHGGEHTMIDLDDLDKFIESAKKPDDDERTETTTDLDTRSG